MGEQGEGRLPLAEDKGALKAGVPMGGHGCRGRNSTAEVQTREHMAPVRGHTVHFGRISGKNSCHRGLTESASSGTWTRTSPSQTWRPAPC